MHILFFFFYRTEGQILCCPPDPAIQTNSDLVYVRCLEGKREGGGGGRESRKGIGRKREGGDGAKRGETTTAISFVNPSHSAADRGCQHARRVCR